MGSKFHLSLRVSRVICSLVVLGLSIYVDCQHKALAPTPRPTQIDYLTFVSCLSLVFSLYLETVHNFAPSESLPYIPYLRLGIEGAISIFYMGGFVALTVFLAKQKPCRESMCTAIMAMRIDIAFAGLSYVVWVASATIHGIEISKSRLEDSIEWPGDVTEKNLMDS